MKGTTSFSELIMPMISRSSVNSSLAIPSKHFFKCGCTRSGSFVSDSISSSSSLDRKKNLPEKYNYFPVMKIAINNLLIQFVLLLFKILVYQRGNYYLKSLSLSDF